MATSWIDIEVDGRTVRVSSPDKLMYPERRLTKLDLVEYLLVVGPGLLRAVEDRPTVMHRFPDGVAGESFFQKRVGRAPQWIDRVEVAFPSGGTAIEWCPTSLASLVWAANLGCLEFHPWQVRRRDLLRPDELRLDLDPAPGVPFADVVEVARVAREVLADAGLAGFAKTSGKRGLHIFVRIQPRWGYLPVRRCVLALAREIERRIPQRATSAWWKEDRGERVFVDFNQNLPDRTIAAAYSFRPTADAMVSCPVFWEEIPDLDPRALNVTSVPDRFRTLGDPMAGLDEQAFGLDVLLEWVARDERNGEGEAPFPPHFPKVPGEPPRVHPSRARKSGGGAS